jgi:hypothetical protein
MPGQQLDLFSARGTVEQSPVRSERCAMPADIEDEILIAAIAESNLADGCEFAAEAGRRQLAAAVPALAALCRRFAGFGTRRVIPEQAAAIEALAMIGGRDAADAVSEMIERATVQGPGLRIAVSAAARLRSILSPDVLRQLLQHDDPAVRADACCCARPLPQLILLLIDLLDDLNHRAARSAACALGRMGRIEARSKLKSLLRAEPSDDVIDAVSLIADEECVVLLGRIARSGTILADAARASLEDIDLPPVIRVAAPCARIDAPPPSTGRGPS